MISFGDLWHGRPLVRRSPKWRAVRQAWLAEHPYCASCGRETSLNVHHIYPVHRLPNLELDEGNLITLCEHKTFNCHLMFGHCGNWQGYRHNVNEVAARVLEALSE